MSLYFSFQQPRDAEKLGVDEKMLRRAFENKICPRCSENFICSSENTPYCANCGFPEHDFYDQDE